MLEVESIFINLMFTGGFLIAVRLKSGATEVSDFYFDKAFKNNFHAKYILTPLPHFYPFQLPK